ncbi:MAG: sugar ABC transporter substrate-binding protein [Oscillospiraceae bacterium]|nr:sugar ABC transporter substrate-binding protein [Oscillospiraceae bacterium]
MKKLLALVLCAVMAFTLLAACTPQTATTDPTPPAELPADADMSTVEGWGAAMRAMHEGTEITVAMATHPGTEAMQRAMVEDFTRLTGIEVNWRVINEVQLNTDLLLDFAGGTGQYDVIMVDGFWIGEFASRGVAEPLSRFINDANQTPPWYDFEDIIAAYRQGISSFDGVQLTIPMAGETRFIAYRTDLFEAHGQTPPTTMAEFLELARFFNGIEDGLFGVSMRAARGIHCASGWMTIMYNFSDGFIDQQTLEPTMTDPGTVESLQFFVDLLQNAPPDVATFTHEEALGTFLEGRAAMWLDATALASRILDPEQSRIYDRVGFVPTPTGPAGDAAALAGWGLGIGANSQNQDAAWAFIVYMTGRPQAKVYVQNGGTPTRASIYLDPEMVAADASFPVQLESFDRAQALVERGISWLPPTENLGPMLDVVGTYANMAIIGQISVEDAIERSQEALLDLDL